MIGDAAAETLTGLYTEAEFRDNFLRVRGGAIGGNLARLMIRESNDMPGWIATEGVYLRPSRPLWPSSLSPTPWHFSFANRVAESPRSCSEAGCVRLRSLILL